SGSNISLIPYALGAVAKDHHSGSPEAYRREVGMDAKIALGSSLNLDLTVNPDFSQVDVDVQVTNLDRFELFFPERRQFFLENGDIFSGFGYDGIRPFFSRRIGLNAPIQAGGRLSGKINKNWRVGLMSMKTGESESQIPGSFFNVLSVQRQVFKRSFISGIFVNRDLAGTSENGNTPAYNRTAGLEFNLASEDNKWIGKAFFVSTFSPEQKSDHGIFAANITKLGRHLKYS